MTIEELVERARAYQPSRALLTALELDLFTAVGDGGTAAEVAGRLQTDPRATAMLLNALVALDALTKEGDTFRNLPALAPYLVAGSERYARPGLLHTANLWESWSGLTEAVRSGSAMREPKVGGDDPQWTEAFIAAMHRNARGQAEELVAAVGVDGVERMLDVGGGSGAYSIAFARAAPGLRAEVLDIEAVVPITRRYIAEARLADRVTARVGDLRTDELRAADGTGYDLVLASAICHMLSPDENRDLLRRCHDATSPGGRLVIREFILDENRAGPPRAALFALNMLVATRAGSSYTESEYAAWMREAGYDRVERPQEAPDLMVGTRRAAGAS